MKRILTVLAICFVPFSVARANTVKTRKPNIPIEEQRRNELIDELCMMRGVDCEYANSILTDSRIVITEPPPPTEQPTTPEKPDPEKNPYFRKKYGLDTPETLERCRVFIQAHEFTFEAAEVIYGVPREIICAHMRIETRLGIWIKPDKNPLGAQLAINALVSLYARRPLVFNRKLKKWFLMDEKRFEHRQHFAFVQTKDLIQTSEKFGWDIFKLPGSSTGAVGLLQFEPESFWIAVDGDGDGTVDLFNPDDAILSLAHYLVTRGFDANPEHRRRAIFAYYGGTYSTDPNKYYMNAVLRYATKLKGYLTEHPIDPKPIAIPDLLPLPLQEQEVPSDNETASQ